MKVKYSEDELANIIGSVRAAENTDEMPKMCWARAAKVLEALVADRLKIFENYRDDSEGIEILLKETINRQQKLLRRLVELVDPIEHELGECKDCDLVREVMKELGDD